LLELLTVPIQVVGSRPQQARVVFEWTKSHVATLAKQRPECAGLVTVIDMDTRGSSRAFKLHVTDRAAPALFKKHPIEISERDSVSAFQVRLSLRVAMTLRASDRPVEFGAGHIGNDICDASVMGVNAVERPAFGEHLSHRVATQRFVGNPSRV